MATVDEHPAATSATAAAAGDIAVENPATGEVIAHVPDMTAEQVAELARAARAAQPAWEALGFEGRGPHPAPRPEVGRRQLRARDPDDRLGDRQGLRGRPASPRSCTAPTRSASGRRTPRRFLADERVKTAAPLLKGKKLVAALPAAGPRRRHRTVELPADQLVRRLHPRAGGRQRSDPQAQRGHAADVACCWPRRCASAACPRASSPVATGRGDTGAARDRRRST